MVVQTPSPSQVPLEESPHQQSSLEVKDSKSRAMTASKTYQQLLDAHAMSRRTSAQTPLIRTAPLGSVRVIVMLRATNAVLSSSRLKVHACLRVRFLLRCFAKPSRGLIAVLSVFMIYPNPFTLYYSMESICHDKLCDFRFASTQVEMAVSHSFRLCSSPLPHLAAVVSKQAL